MLKKYGIQVISIVITLLPSILNAQPADYSVIFGDDWAKAEKFETENRYWMEPVLKRHNIPYELAVSVIFPELVRYSALRDKIETTLLKALYINLGDEYANFSIGTFQIKPSFASFVRTQSHGVMGRRSSIRFGLPGEYDDISNYRKSIVADLEDPKMEFDYVVAFFRICEKKFKTGRMEEVEKVRFLSTAYNYGIDRSPEQIRNMIEKKFFTTKLINSVSYCYSDISLFRYRQLTGISQEL